MKNKPTILVPLDKNTLDNSAYEINYLPDGIEILYGRIGDWNYPGEVAASIIDTENGYEFRSHGVKKPVRLDYDQFHMLSMLIKLGSHIPDFKLFEEKSCEDE